MAETDGFDINQQVCLLAIDDTDRKGEVSAAVQELGYRVHLAASGDDARERLRKNSYQLVVVDEAFQGGTLLDNPLVRLLQGMPMTTRRHMFVALLGDSFKTLDNLTAFVQSVNGVVNYNDVAQIKPVLQRAIADNDQFFRVMLAVLDEAGKR